MILLLVESKCIYIRRLKRKLKQEDVQFVSGTHKLKIVAADGKQYNSDALSADDIILLAKHYPNSNKSLLYG